MEQQTSNLAQQKNVVVIAPNYNEGVYAARQLNINRFNVFVTAWQLAGMRPDKIYWVNPMRMNDKQWSEFRDETEIQKRFGCKVEEYHI